jgi:hypothetical protein
MDIEAAAVVQGERQVGKKPPLRDPELAARPLDDDPCLHIELLARIADRAVVVAEHGHGPLVDQIHDGRHRPVRVGAIADIVAEQHEALPAMIAGLREAGAECRPVGVDVRENGDQHGSAPISQQWSDCRTRR